MNGVWTDVIIATQCELHGLVTPYDPELVNPASIDLRLSDEWIDMRRNVKHSTELIHLEPGDAILASTLEYVRIPKSAAGLVLLKSSLARQGLDHALAGWCDPSFNGNLTLELHAHRPITLMAGQRIVQLVLFSMFAPPQRSYAETGRYQGQMGPTPSRG